MINKKQSTQQLSYMTGSVPEKLFSSVPSAAQEIALILVTRHLAPPLEPLTQLRQKLTQNEH